MREMGFGDVPDDVSHGADAEAWVEIGDAAKATAERAAAGRLDDARNDEALFEQVVTRRWQSIQRCWTAPINAAKTAALSIAEQLRPNALRLAGNDGVHMRQCLLCPVRDVRTARHDADAKRTVPVSQGISGFSEPGEEREGHKIGLSIDRNRPNLLMENLDLVLRRGDGREMYSRNGRNEVEPVAAAIAGLIADYNSDFHRCAAFAFVAKIEAGALFGGGGRQADQTAAAEALRPPYRRSRRRKSASAAASSSGPKSGQKRGVK